ncbi:MAG TPA: hypothetical protein VMW38_20735 [Terriglobia bacterium]|nr:hypothetical protein [Terriglobia bacterium]
MFQWMMMKPVTRFCTLAIAVILCTGHAARAQSTIFNIPTTDVVAKGKIYVEFDYLSQIPKVEDLPAASPTPRLQVFVPRGVVGLGANVEAGANVSVVHVGESNNVFLQPNVKWKFFSNEGGVAASVGGILYTPINHREGVDTYGLVYANLSKKIRQKYGPRFHVGPYGIVGSNSTFVGPKAGAIAGYEQPILARLSIVADWISGKNAFGYFTPGVSVTFPGNGVFNAGYSIGNDSYDGNSTHNRLLFLYYGFTF